MNINIDMNSLRYGIYIGFKLSRLEWIWDNKLDIAKKEFEPSKKELLFQLPDGILIDETSYKTFSQSILGYYFRTDISVYYSILIGITIQRCVLVGASKNINHNEELRELAQSVLTAIPKRIVSDKATLFNIILMNRDKDLFEIIKILEELSVMDTTKSYSNRPTLFLSYCQRDEVIANIIENQLKYETNNGIEISRYTRVPYKESFKTFMNSIQNHDFVLCIVSDSYLKSQACMYEVGEIIKDRNFESKLLFVVLGEKDNKYYSSNNNCFVAAKVYGSEKNRIEYIKYWKNEYDQLKTEIDSINDYEANSFLAEKLKEIGRIYRNDISEFTTYLSENNGKSFEELYSNNFYDILKLIFPNWESHLFANCKSFSELLTNAIEKIAKITLTDYNQIALSARITRHETGLVVFADNVVETKQRYRLVIMEGLMAKVFSTGKMMNIGDIDKEPEYFPAVMETKSELIIPIKFQGNIIGVINSESEKYNYYTEFIVKKLNNIVSNLEFALNRLGYVSNMSKDDIPYIHMEFTDKML